MSQILGRPGMMMSAALAAAFGGMLAGDPRPVRPRAYNRRARRSGGRSAVHENKPNPAGTKLARQAAGAACTLRGRKPNGSYMR